jgi:molybdenum cofactor cytidylyltransferase
MGQPKQLLEVGGRPMLEAVVAQATASRLDEVMVVLGANAEEIRSRVELGRARIFINSRHETGMASSLRAGLASLDGRTEVAVIILGDQPDIETGLLDRLLDLQEESGLPAAALSFAGLLHPPVVLRRELWPDVMSLEGDVGCRAVIRARPELVAALEVSGRKHPVDVDTPEDYERLVRR